MTTEAAPARARFVPGPPGRWATPVPAGGRRSLRPGIVTGAARPDHDGILQGSRARFLARLAVF